MVVDTNILISAVLYGGKPEQVLRYVLTTQQLVLSDYIVEEFMTYIKNVRPKAPQKWLRLLRQKLEVYCYDDTADLAKPVRDINDTNILQLAIAQRAVLVTGDKDLLEYKAEARVAILSTHEYAELLGYSEILKYK